LTTKIQNLLDNDSLAIMSSADAASDMLGLSDYKKPKVIQETLERFLEDLDAGRVRNTLGPAKGAMALGSLWGNSLLDAYKWKWVRVKHGDWEALGLIDPELRYLALPHQMFVKLLAEDCDPSMAGPAFRFTAIGSGGLPESSPGSLTVITN
jgi:hypothetical protein